MKTFCIVLINGDKVVIKAEKYEVTLSGVCFLNKENEVVSTWNISNIAGWFEASEE